MRRRNKEASDVKQTARLSNTVHPRQSLFQRKMSMYIHVYYYYTIIIEQDVMYYVIHLLETTLLAIQIMTGEEGG